MTLADMRQRMDREFAAVRAELKRIETLVSAGNKDAKEARRAQDRLDRALAVLRSLEWGGAHDRTRRGPGRCPACGGAEPRHAADCALAAALS